MNPAGNPACSTNRALKPSKIPGMTNKSGAWISVRHRWEPFHGAERRA
jgi:hypothetical protein